MKYVVIFLIAFTSCSPGREVILPFKNLGYSGDRIFPAKTNFSDFTFRIWISNSTSIDRIISISKDSLEDFHGCLTEVGKLSIGKKSKQYYRQIEIKPKSGFVEFKNKIDKLNLLYLSSQEKLLELVLHQPFSTYVVEIKDKKQFNTFKFDTYYPNTTQSVGKYDNIEKLIFDEFDVMRYFKFQK